MLEYFPGVGPFLVQVSDEIVWAFVAGQMVMAVFIVTLAYIFLFRIPAKGQTNPVNKPARGAKVDLLLGTKRFKTSY